MTPIDAVDTNVIVAGLLSWHEFHHAAREVLSNALRRRPALVVPVPALLESFSVMTRLPMPHCLSAVDAAAALTGTFKTRVRLAALPAGNVWPFVGDLVAQGVRGGRVYDSLILESARHAGVTRLWTFNRRDFEDLEIGRVEIAVPGAAR